MTAIERSGSALAARSTSINSLVFRRKSPSAKHRAPTRSFIFFFKYVKGCSSAQLWLQWRERESSEGKIEIYLKTPELPIWIQCLWKLCQFNWEIRSFSNHYNISTPLNFFFLFWELEKGLGLSEARAFNWIVEVWKSWFLTLICCFCFLRQKRHPR